MLYWRANFQIPNSGVQAAEVYAVATNDDKLIVKFYGDKDQKIFLFEKEFISTSSDPYEYLLSLEDFSNYVRL